MHTVIDGRAMKNTMCASKWHTQRHRLTELSLSKVTLSVADNHQIPSQGQWTSVIDVAGTETTQSLEVFDSNGAFQVILGKPWLHHVQAMHKYETDEITIQVKGRTTTIRNDDDGAKKPEPQTRQRQRGGEEKKDGLNKEMEHRTATQDSDAAGGHEERRAARADMMEVTAGAEIADPVAR